MKDMAYERSQELSVGEAIATVKEKLGIINCSVSSLYHIASVREDGGPYGKSTVITFNRYAWCQLELAVERCNLLKRLASYSKDRDENGESEQTKNTLGEIVIDFRNELSKFDNSLVTIINGRVKRLKTFAA